MEEPKSKEYREYLDRHNYQCQREIMVTVTLAEYRELVAENATLKERVAQSLKPRMDAEGK